VTLRNRLLGGYLHSRAFAGITKGDSPFDDAALVRM
jgi:hypothetical protein